MEDISAAQLIGQPSFVNYCFRANPEDVAYWEQYQQAHPEQAPVIAEAKNLLQTGGWLLLAEKEKPAALARLDAYLATGAAKRRRLQPWYFAAAAAAAILAFVFIVFPGKQPVQPAAQAYYYSAAGTARQGVTLPDSSFVLLESGAELRLADGFGKNGRTMYLRGTAYFQVAKNHLQPFSVQAGPYTVTALGTAFRLTSANSVLQVYLEEGRVKVEETKNGATALVAILEPGDRLDLRAAAAAGKAPAPVRSTFKPAELKAWKASEIVFDNTPLRDVVKQLEACYGISISIDSASLRKETFSGRFRNDALPAVLEVLCFTLNKQYEISPDSNNVTIR